MRRQDCTRRTGGNRPKIRLHAGPYGLLWSAMHSSITNGRGLDDQPLVADVGVKR